VAHALHERIAGAPLQKERRNEQFPFLDAGELLISRITGHPRTGTHSCDYRVNQTVGYGQERFSARLA
jgi:hypothetical protein